MKYLVTLLFLLSSYAMDAQEDLSVLQDGEGNVKLFAEKMLLDKQDELERAYLPFFDNDHMMMGIYTLKAGAEDGQSPHKIDEAYYVLEGKAKFEVSGTKMEVQPGAIIFVKANASHRFYEIEEDLRLLVFFAKHE